MLILLHVFWFRDVITHWRCTLSARCRWSGNSVLALAGPEESADAPIVRSNAFRNQNQLIQEDSPQSTPCQNLHLVKTSKLRTLILPFSFTSPIHTGPPTQSSHPAPIRRATLHRHRKHACEEVERTSGLDARGSTGLTASVPGCTWKAIVVVVASASGSARSPHVSPGTSVCLFPTTPGGVREVRLSGAILRSAQDTTEEVGDECCTYVVRTAFA